MGDVVIVKSEERNRGKWPLGVIVQLIIGRDGIVRGARLRAGKGHLERAVQHLYPLELSCDRSVPESQVALRAEAAEFRPTRNAAAVAKIRIQDDAEESDDLA